MTTTSHQRPGRLAVAGWWAVTVLTLVVLDDLTFGPAFWALSRWAGPGVAVAAIFAIYVPAQVLLVVQGTSEHPSGPARWFLRRLDLERRNAHVRDNEMLLRSKVVGTASATLMSLLVAGVLPPLILWRRGAPRRYVRRLSVLTGTVYAFEFALLHGFLPSLI
jgi:hypothetical protein